MSGNKRSFCNLIQFVSQKSNAENQEVKVTTETCSSECDEGGKDVKSFYETLINEDAPSGKKVNLPDPARKDFKKKLKGNYKSVIAKTKSTSEDVIDDKTTQLGPGDKTVFSKRSEPILKDSSTCTTVTSEFNRPPTPVSFQRLRQHSKLLQASQMGHLEQVSKLIEGGANINYQDFYGWTPLMCAAKEGHKKVVQYLLQHGADHTINNLEGQTACLLAKMSKHGDIVTTISDHKLDNLTQPELNSTPNGAEKQTNTTGAYFCHVCRSEFSVSEQASHETSTVHLFNSGHKRKGPTYLIPESNKGFQILVRTGWDVEKGLGPNGEGPKYPVKTILKYDRKGLGSDVCVKKKAKITHFNPNDKSAIADNFHLPQRKMTASKAAKYATKMRERKEIRREKQLRFELSDF